MLEILHKCKSSSDIIERKLPVILYKRKNASDVNGIQVAHVSDAT